MSTEAASVVAQPATAKGAKSGQPQRPANPGKVQRAKAEPEKAQSATAAGKAAGKAEQAGGSAEAAAATGSDGGSA